jgi:hypothetical protein
MGRGGEKGRMGEKEKIFLQILGSGWVNSLATDGLNVFHTRHPTPDTPSSHPPPSANSLFPNLKFK